VIRLLIVDDSALMRRQLVTLFEEAGGYVIEQARNGREAIEANRRFAPDVVTLDINMPEMDGLSALSQMMLDRPVPVVMVSSLTDRGALVTLEALNLGAVDFVLKPGGTISLSLDAVRDELLRKVRAARRARVRGTIGRTAGVASAPTLARPARAVGSARPPRPNTVAPTTAGVVVIGVSTGGPRTLEEILPLLPADFPWPVLVAQHMPAAFTGPFAQRLDQASALDVVEVTQSMPVEAGRVYVAKGGADLIVARRAGVLTALPRPEHPDHLWHPSVDMLMTSVLAHCTPSQVIGVLLTGMGYDGAATFTELKQRGGRTIAEHESTCVVFGMPAELIERGGAGLVLPSHQIARQLTLWAGR
jgi:two-component system, chemotaxis family, protein-glutamate methylesterase/glutaminase